MPSYNKKDFKQSNVNYLNKDFGQLKQSLISYAKSYFPDSYRDFNETSPGMMLLEMSAYVGDVLSFYVDQQYKEMLLPLAEERRNVVNMAKMFGYKVKPIVPAYVDVTFKSDVSSVVGSEHLVDYSSAATSEASSFPAGIKVTSNANTDLVFETLDIVDFTVTGSDDGQVIATTDTDTGLVSSYTLSRKVKAVSGEQKTVNFTVADPTKFLKLTIEDTNVIDIISCVDSNGNNWYEVDFLAQEYVPIETHYTQDVRGTAYEDVLPGEGNTTILTDVAVPYSLQYLRTSKRFTRETNPDNTTSLVFGNGISRDGRSLDDTFVELEQAGISIPGITADLDDTIDPLLGDDYSTLGEAPTQTTLTITYRVGGGINSNAASGDLSQFATTSPIAGSGAGVLKSVTNEFSAIGGRDEETTDEIREKAKAFFTTQNRCVTKEDFEARVMNIPSKFGSIGKVYVSRFGGALSGDVDLTGTISNLNTFATVMNTSATTINNLVLPSEAANENGSTSTADEINILGADVSTIRDATTTLINSITNVQTGISTIPASISVEGPVINIFVLAYDSTKNLVGNPNAGADNPLANATDNVPSILLNNIKNYLENFKILTDDIEIMDGHIVNFGVFFDVVSHKYANKNEVKIKCIEKIKDYFSVEKMQFSQAIYVSQLEYELMNVDGVRAVNYVTITQRQDYNFGNSDGVPVIPPTYTYSTLADGTILTAGQDFEGQTVEGTVGYGYKYDFESALQDGVILPPHPNNPGVFELKFPNQNIKGVVH